MKILRVVQKLYPSVIGGGPYHVHALSRDQAAMGHEVTVATIRNDSNLPTIEHRNGYTIRRFSAVASPLGNDISPDMARFLATASGYDVVHAHSHLYFSTVLAAVTSLRKTTPLAITNHGLYSQSAPRAVFDAYLRTVGRLTFNVADTVFCYTGTDRQRLRDRGITADISVVPNGVDTSMFTPEGPNSKKFDTSTPILLFVGRLVKGKRPLDLIRALPRIRERIPDLKLVICGDGPLRDTLEQEATTQNVANAVTFLGTIPYNEMPRVYRSCDILALPSEAEGFPRTVLESLASGTPVVTSDLPQLRSLASNAVQSVPIGDISALADAIAAKFMGDDQPSEQLARQQILGQYDWSETVQQTTKQLKNLTTQ